MKSILVYYPFTISRNANSGSKLRPIEMLSAFEDFGKEHGLDVILISGSSQERKNQFNELKALGKLDNLLYCYMENQTIPIWLTDTNHIPKAPFIDYQVLSFLQKKRVPVGVFYRDVYWKFDELYPLKGIKKKIMQTIYRFEERFYSKYCSVIFLPSMEMGKFVDINQTFANLPPGGKMRPSTGERNTSMFHSLYVGGINNEDYGLGLLIESLRKLNMSNPGVVSLTIVCREDEYKNVTQEMKESINSINAQVKHVSGESLNELYKSVDFAYIPRYKSTYNDFSVPVKLVEYLSNGLPIVATNCEAQKSFIEEGSYGVICEDNPDSMYEAIKTMVKNKSVYKQNIQATFLEKHSWKARVKKVHHLLSREEI
ncbi:glycosyltransferase [Rossellomorea aquimaris]|uniref:glycosyltransferase n=1 Tax=Rossellomorea aquimaris TaxID=189382 RepID=UPI0007D05C29|nr:glycosyltransferase [Rossellomorea aquimaris]